MRTLLVSVLFALVACGDSTGPEGRRFHDAYVMVRLGTQPTPAPLNLSVTFTDGGLVCPPAESGQPAQEVYTFDHTDPRISGLSTIRFEVECEVEKPNRIRYTYPATGEIIIGTIWKSVGQEGGQFFQTKKLPGRTTFLATIATLGWNMEFWGYRVPEDPAPEGTFRRNR